MDILTNVKKEFNGEGKLSTIVPDFKKREEQIMMAEIVSNSLSSGVPSIIEAGTGIGKSFAYLLPAALWAKKHKKRIAVSTYTKLLQSQLINKDLPVIAEITGIKYDVAYGSENYFCIDRWKTGAGLFSNTIKQETLKEIENNGGILLNLEKSQELKNFFGRRTELCSFKDCKFYEECFYYQAKKRWKETEILVVNHSLFLSHCIGDYSLLPEIDFIIFDEGHKLEESAVSTFGEEVKISYVLYFIDSLLKLTRMREISKYQKIRYIRQLIQKLKEIFIITAQRINSSLTKVKRIRNYEIKLFNESFYSFVEELVDELKTLSEKTSEETKKFLEEKIFNLSKIIMFFSKFDEGESNFVKWIEKNGDSTIFYSKPIDTAELFKNYVFSKYKNFTITSATLSVNNSFSFIKKRLGVPPAVEKILSSPFDYKKKTLMYIASDLPVPDDERYIKAISRKIKEIIKITKGRALILFTSYEMMNRCFENTIKNREEGVFYLKQGDKERNILLEIFKEQHQSVLFATSSFWEGVDIPGTSLVCVVITKLPFEVPDDPRLKEVVENIKNKGRNAFMEYQVPLAVMRLKQGAGRLMRKEEDFGAICILDSRIVKRKYGSTFLNSFPTIPKTSSFRNLKIFFDRRKHLIK